MIEDEARVAKRLERLIRSILGDSITTFHWCDEISAGLQYLNTHAIDLLFLDLNLNGEDGFTVLEEMVAASFHTIIVSAYRNQALRAFEYGVLDFVPKPFTEDRLVQALKRLQSAPTQDAATRYLAVKRKGRRVLLSVEDLLYVQGAGVYTELHLKDGRTAIHNKTLDALRAILPNTYERIHKSYLVCMTEAQEIVIQPGSKYSLRLTNGEQLPIGRTKYKALRERWFE